MNISKNKAVADREDQGTIVHVKDELNEKQFYGPNNDLPVTITVVGSYSKTYRRAKDASRDRMLKKQSGDIDGDQLDQSALDLVASCVLAWEGFFDGEGEQAKPVPCRKANVIALFNEAPWIRAQVENAMNDHARFFAAS